MDWAVAELGAVYDQTECIWKKSATPNSCMFVNELNGSKTGPDMSRRKRQCKFSNMNMVEAHVP